MVINQTEKNIYTTHVANKIIFDEFLVFVEEVTIRKIPDRRQQTLLLWVFSYSNAGYTNFKN